jgi:hypothetical protein
MATKLVDIPIQGGAYQNIDEIQLGPYSPSLYNGYVDEAGVNYIAPGLLEYCDLNQGAPVDGCYWWPKQNVLIIFCNGKVFKQTSSVIGSTATDITGTATGIQLGTPVTVADFGDTLYAANGANVVKITTTTSVDHPDGDCPTNVTHVVAMDSYLLTLASDGYINFSQVGDPDNFDPLDFFSAVKKPDLSTAIKLAWSELIVTGEESFEVWRDDGVTPFVPNDNAYVETGVIAPYSLKLVDNAWHFIDQRGRLVRVENRVPKVVSRPMDKIISQFSSVVDCKVDEILVEGRPFLILHFPTAGRTLAYDYSVGDANGWSEWAAWDSGSSSYERWYGNCAAYCPDWGYQLVGDYRNSKVYIVSPDYNDNNGTTLRWARRTGSLDYGTDNRKSSYGLRVRLKKTNTATPPTLVVRFRDDGSTTWSDDIDVPMGYDGDTHYLARIDGPLGHYTTRQWEFVISDNIGVTIASARELVDMNDGY